MDRNCLDQLQGLFESARTDLQGLKAKLDEVRRMIDEDRLIPDSLSDEVQNMLSACRDSKAALIDTVEKYAISTDISMEDMKEEISKKLEVSNIRQLLSDYFRLTSEAGSVLEKLNDAKQELKKKCRLPRNELQEALVPYQVVVDYVSGKTSEISDEQSELIEGAMGRTISRAIDKGQIILGDAAEGEKWMEDIDAFAPAEQPLAPVTETAVPEAAAEPEMIPESDAEPARESMEETVSELTGETKECGRPDEQAEMWPGFSGYIPRGTVEFKDIPASASKANDFRNLARKKPSYPSVLDRMHDIRMFRLESTQEQYRNAALESRAAIESLIKKGYLATVTFNDPEGQKAEFVHITSLGHEALSRYYRENLPLTLYRKWNEKAKKEAGRLSELYFYRCRMLCEWMTGKSISSDSDYISDIVCAYQDNEYVYCNVDKDSFVVPALFTCGTEQKWLDVVIEAISEFSDDCLVNILVKDREDIPFLRDSVCADHPEYDSHLRFINVGCDLSGTSPSVMPENLPEESCPEMPEDLPEESCPEIPENLSEASHSAAPEDLSETSHPETAEDLPEAFCPAASEDLSETFHPADPEDLPEPSAAETETPGQTTESVPEPDGAEIADPVSPAESGKPEPAAAGVSAVFRRRSIEDVRRKIASYEKKAYEAFAADRQDVGSIILKSLCLETKDENGLEEEYLRLSQAEKRYAFATGDPMLSEDYRTSNLHNAFNLPYGDDEAYDALAVSAFLRMFFSAGAGIEAYSAANLQFANNIAVKKNPALNDLLYELAAIVKESFTGLDSQVLSVVFKNGNVKEKQDIAQKTAQGWTIGNRLLTSPHGNKRIKETRKRLFGPDTVLRRALETVAANDMSQIDNVKQAMARVNNCVVPQTIEQMMDEVWDTTAYAQDRKPLVGAERTTLTKQLLSIYHAFEEWLDAAQLIIASSRGASVTQKALSAVHAGLLNVCQGFDQQHRAGSVEACGAQRVLERTVTELLQRFDNSDNEERARNSYYIHLLEHPLVAVGEGFIPHIEHPSEETSDFNFCERACEYLTLPSVDWKTVIDGFFAKDSSRTGGDYGCAGVLHDYLELYETLDIWPGEYANIQGFADEAINPKSRAIDAVQMWQQDFQGRLDMADGDEWFKEPDERKRLEKIINEQKRVYYFSNNFGFYGRAMLRVLENMARDAEQLRSEYESQLKSVQSSGTIPHDAPIFSLAAKMIDKNCFGAFRSYLQMAERGETDVTESRLSNDQSYFAKFCTQCRDLCYKTRLNRDNQTLLSVYRKSGMFKENAIGRTALVLMQNWLESKSANPQNQADKVRNIVEALGIPVETALKEGTGIHLSLKTPGRVESYPHPIADFGSRMYENGLQVQALYGNLLPADVLFSNIREILQKNKRQSFLILVNCAIPLDERRKFATLVAENMIQSPFIVVDRVLALFLTAIPQAERWKAMLQCSLPFHVINPYSENSAVEIPPEMFIGRTNELESIRNPKGANLIYGGRQLGKTALLKRARTLEHLPSEHSWAVYEDIKNKKSSEASVRIAKTLTQERFFDAMPEVTSWSELMECIEDRLVGNSDRLLLLLDEADAFLVEAGRNDYREIDDLKTLQNRMNPRFKCVMAGLHNVLRIDNTKALTNNSSLVHLQGLTVKPLDFKDARALLEIPLSYLGFTIPEEHEDIITQILYNTNYFPGLVHFYASRLVEYAKKNSNAMIEPPYRLKTETLLSLLAEQDFHDLRNDRIRMTLYIDANEHSYYDILATTMCYGYNYLDQYKLYGMTAADIKRECVSLEPKCSIARLSETQIKALMDELVVLNIFREEKGYYQFRRASFTEIFSSPEEAENHFVEILTREVN